MLRDFRDFLFKQNALALAVGVIIGAAIGRVVQSLVNDLLMRRTEPEHEPRSEHPEASTTAVPSADAPRSPAA